MIRNFSPAGALKRIRIRPNTIWSPSITAPVAKAPSRSMPIVACTPFDMVTVAPASW